MNLNLSLPDILYSMQKKGQKYPTVEKQLDALPCENNPNIYMSLELSTTLSLSLCHVSRKCRILSILTQILDSRFVKHSYRISLVLFLYFCGKSESLFNVHAAWSVKPASIAVKAAAKATALAMYAAHIYVQFSLCLLQTSKFEL